MQRTSGFIILLLLGLTTGCPKDGEKFCGRAVQCDMGVGCPEAECVHGYCQYKHGPYGGTPCRKDKPDCPLGSRCVTLFWGPNVCMGW